MMGRGVGLWRFHRARSGGCLPQGESSPVESSPVVSSPVVSLVGEMPIVRVLEIQHTADTLGLEPVAFHRIQSLRRGAES
jgi:hypothetical protein